MKTNQDVVYRERLSYNKAATLSISELGTAINLPSPTPRPPVPPWHVIN